MAKHKEVRRAPSGTSKKRKPPRKAAPKLGSVSLPATLFTVRPTDLARLNPEDSVEVFQELLWAEARRVGLPTTRIHVSRLVDVPDGGIDASVEADNLPTASDILGLGKAGFQIKAGGTFEPWKKSQIKKELFRTKSPKRENLGESIRACLDNGSRYILVCTKADPNQPQRRAAVKHFKDFFVECGYENPKVEVWGQSHLIGILQRFPSLCLRLNGRGGLRFQTHGSWSQQDEMKRPFKVGEPQTKFISGLTSELRRFDRPIHARVWGDAGIGKTRLVLEATRAEDLRPLVIYCDKPENFRDTELMSEILKEGNQFAAVIVVDECDPDGRSYIWNRMRDVGERIKLVTIYNEFDKTSGDIMYIDAPPLEKEPIIEIIKEYAIPAEQAERWAEFCSGSPRVAHVIGQNLKNNPEDLLRSPDTVNVWDRFTVGRDDPNSPKVEQRRLVLRYVALFKRFGYGGRLVHEAKAIAAIIERANPVVTWPRFQEIVTELRARKILQGQSTLYLTPKLLHIKLWTDWWHTYGEGFDIEEFTARLPEKLLEWFHEMFQFAAESQAAQRIVKELLGENGIFQRSCYFRDSRGARFFLALSEANPEAALKCLKDTIGKLSKEELLLFKTGRREVVWALEKIAVWHDLFPDTARLLLALGEAENETWGNNASGVFTGLFSLGPGRVAPTEASPEERFPILREAMESDSKERRLLGLRACDSALEAQHFIRIGSVEHQGLRREPELWRPQTWGELLDAYRHVWRLLCDRMGALPDDESGQAVDILLKRTRGMARYGNLLDMLIDTLRMMADRAFVDRRKIFETVQRILHYDGKAMLPEVRGRWEQLRGQLLGEDFHSLMERYVAMDLLEDRIDEDGKSTDRAGSQLDKLAALALQQPELLDRELSWLVTDHAKNGFRFGFSLATKDVSLALLPSLLVTQRNAVENASGFFLGGYMRRVRETDVASWENLLEELAQDRKLRLWVPELSWRSGPMTDRSARRILELARNGAIGIGHFRMFGFGSVTADLSEDVITDWIEFLLDDGSPEAISISLDLHHFYYCRKEARYPLPVEFTLRLLTAPSLFRKAQRHDRSQMDDYYWTELGRGLVEKYPQASLKLADMMLQHFAEDGTILEGFGSSTYEVLDGITRRFPSQVWDRVAKYLGPPIDSRAYHLRSWLRGDEHYPSGERGILPVIPLKDIWRWVDEDVEKRAWYVASFVPKQLFRREGEVCLAREVLVRYGAREDVRNNLMANFGTESWWGPESSHLAAKRQILLEFRKGETNENVNRWIYEYVVSLDREIERARTEEERRH